MITKSGYPSKAKPVRKDVQRYVGAYSNGAPPLPIPNREVKPVSADGTGVDAPGE